MGRSIVFGRCVRPVQRLVAVGERGQGGGASVAEDRVVEDGTGAQRSCRRTRRQFSFLHLLLLSGAEHRLLVRGELGDVGLEGVAPGQCSLKPLEDGGCPLWYERGGGWRMGC